MTVLRFLVPSSNTPPPVLQDAITDQIIEGSRQGLRR